MRLPAVRRTGKSQNAAEEFLSGLPGISTELSALALKEAKTAARALEMLTTGEDLAGIGTKKRNKIRDCLGLKEKEILRIMEEPKK